MFNFGTRDCLHFFVLIAAGLAIGSCTQSHASQAAEQAPGLLALNQATPVGKTQLVSNTGLPVTVEYYNVKSDLRTVTGRFGLELTKAKGWKHTKSAELSVFSRSTPNAQVKWQRIAIFKGRLDKSFKHVPNTEKDWVNVVVYRVFKA